MASEPEEFERAIACTLRCLDCPSLQLKIEQETSLRAVYSGKDATDWVQEVSTVHVRLQVRPHRR